MDSKNILIDVRTPDEYSEGHAMGAINLPLSRLEFGALGELESIPKETPLKLYCYSGARSEAAKHILFSLGFKNVENLGGLEEAKRINHS